MQDNPVPGRRKKYSGYRTVLVAWHESVPTIFDPVAALKELANSRGLVVSEKATEASHRLTFDTVESSQLRRRKRNPVDKTVRLDAVKLLRRALKDPRSAERIRALVERSRQGEEVDDDIASAIDLDSLTGDESDLRHRRI